MEIVRKNEKNYRSDVLVVVWKDDGIKLQLMVVPVSFKSIHMIKRWHEKERQTRLC